MSGDRDAFLEAIETAMDGPTPYERALALTLEYFRADSGTIHTRAGQQLELAAASPGIPDVVLAQITTIPIGKGMAGVAAEREEPVDACNLQTDSTGDVRPGARATGLQGSICVPVFREEQVVGTLGIANRTEREFTPEETQLLLEAGRRIGSRTGG